MSTQSLKELIAQKEALERMIQETQQSQKAEAVAKVKELMAENGLTVADIAGRASAAGGGTATKKVAAKYKSADGTQTWSGRGLKPKWLSEALASGKQLADFAV